MLRSLGYIDPGTGSMFIQIIIGAFLAGIVAFRNVIASAVRKLRPNAKSTVSTKTAPEAKSSADKD